jgi:hypothetical protein
MMKIAGKNIGLHSSACKRTSLARILRQTRTHFNIKVCKDAAAMSAETSDSLSFRESVRPELSETEKMKTARQSVKTCGQLIVYTLLCLAMVVSASGRTHQKDIPSPTPSFNTLRIHYLRPVAKLIAILVCVLRLLVIH